jgi:hypothetical protein
MALRGRGIGPPPYLNDEEHGCAQEHGAACFHDLSCGFGLYHRVLIPGYCEGDGPLDPKLDDRSTTFFYSERRRYPLLPHSP